jgi:hypothetical protein
MQVQPGALDDLAARKKVLLIWSHMEAICLFVEACSCSDMFVYLVKVLLKSSVFLKVNSMLVVCDVLQ